MFLWWSGGFVRVIGDSAYRASGAYSVAFNSCSGTSGTYHVAPPENIFVYTIGLRDEEGHPVWSARRGGSSVAMTLAAAERI